MALIAGGRFADAVASCAAALRISRNDHTWWHFYGVALRGAGQPNAAVNALHKAVALASNVPDYHNSLGIAVAAQGLYAAATEHFTRALRLRPAFPAALANLGRTYLAAGRTDLALEPLSQAARLDPSDCATWELLVVTHLRRGDAAELVAARRRTVVLRPDDAAVHSDLLQCLHYDDRLSPEDIFAAHVHWANRFAAPLAPSARAHANDPAPGRRLRVGYLTSGFRDHPVARFQVSAIEHRDATGSEVICYDVSDGLPDAMTDRLRAAADGWRDVTRHNDAALASQIRADGIDVLVDLNGHTTGSRALVLARRPAPVQATYNGYCDTTGMSAVDWRITDALHDPPGDADRRHSERLWRLPGCNWCYAPDAAAPDPGPPPADAGGPPTFGCLNMAVKVSPPAARLWACVLAAVPGARLALLVDGDPARDRSVAERLSALGVPRDRMLLLGRTGRSSYLAYFRRIDVSLDPFPFNGVTTTCDSLWMGVPVVTLAGNAHWSRAGVSILSAVGFPEFIADTPEGYVRLATDLAADAHRLRSLRSRLRAQMAASAICDGRRLARSLDAAYRGMWTEWCARAAR